MRQRLLHWSLLTMLSAALFVVNLGGPTLWDIDEGNNATCAREMLETGNYIVPRFNYDLRVDKPALLYWLQIACYETFGVHEFSARFPSALAAWLAVLLLYELGRRMFDPGTGLLAGIIIASSVMFASAAHFANPDALLTLFMTATCWVFWHFHSRGSRAWLVWSGIPVGLAILAKGPIGIVMPGAVIGTYFLWTRQGRVLLDVRLILGALLCLSICLPWYILVAAETRGAFLFGFLGTHNVNRFLSPMEGHGGPVLYYLAVFAVGAAPWSAFLGLTAWHAWRGVRQPPRAETNCFRFLLVWIGAYVAFFTISRTKLPNYILPAYPALVLLLAHALEGWRRGLLDPPRRLMSASILLLGIMGMAVCVGTLIAGGAIPLPSLRGRDIPGLAPWSLLGGILLVGAVAAWRCLRYGQRDGMIGVAIASSALFVGLLTGWAMQSANSLKPPRELVSRLEYSPNVRMVQVGSYRYFQPSLVFYCKRHVWNMTDEKCVHDLLRSPLPVLLFMPDATWSDLQDRLGTPGRVLGRHRDLYSGKVIALITNE